MKKLFLILIVLSACNSKPGVDGSEFLGKWLMSESSPGYSKENNKMSIEISKKDIFFWVSIKIDGKDFFDELGSDKKTDEEKEISSSFHKYQLSPDKQTLIPISGMIDYIITYHDDNKTIQTGLGWFKKQ